MTAPYRCDCGRSTTNPYFIEGAKVCVVCATDMRPDLVAKRVGRDAREYTLASPKARQPGGPGWSPRRMG